MCAFLLTTRPWHMVFDANINNPCFIVFYFANCKSQMHHQVIAKIITSIF